MKGVIVFTAHLFPPILTGVLVGAGVGSVLHLHDGHRLLAMLACTGLALALHRFFRAARWLMVTGTFAMLTIAIGQCSAGSAGLFGVGIVLWLTEVDQGAVVEHKRLGHVLQVSQVIQAQRDNSRIGKTPSRTHLGVATRVQNRSPGRKKPREFTQADINGVILEQSQQRQMQQPRKPGRRPAQVIDADVSALPVQASSFNNV